MKRSSPVEAIIQTAPDRWLTLTDPVRIVEAGSPGGVAAAIGEVERLTRDEGYFAAGYLAFEAGGAFGLPMRAVDPRSGMPLAWFALFEPVTVSEAGTVAPGGSYELGEAAPSVDRTAFDSAFRQIKSYLAAGDTYQVNFTFRMTASFSGDPKGLFADLVRAQGGRYSAYLNTGSHAICSASPELFFSLDGMDISARPMKGTAPRAMTLAADAQRQAELRNSAKNRAENVMIVDMMRNDLGRIADLGTVDTPELFVVERYPNVWQMTSLVRARTRASLGEIFAALHPSASVTGAPKFRTLEIIGELEAQPRGVYTGAVGYLRPDGNGHFNVAIRTAIVDAARGRAEFGVGSGIVWDSEPASEYDECLLKGAVLGAPPPEFELLETTAWTSDGGFLHLDRHLSRMRDSAEYFGFDYREGPLREALELAVERQSGPLRVRALLARNGAVRVEVQPLETGSPEGPAQPLRVALAEAAIDMRNPFLFHKTTNRTVYDHARVPNVDDVVLWNARGEVTEATRANIVVELEDGAVVTPPISCGLLAGTVRAELCEGGSVREQIVRVDQLKRARRLWLTNSVYGRREAVLARGEEA